MATLAWYINGTRILRAIRFQRISTIDTLISTLFDGSRGSEFLFLRIVGGRRGRKVARKEMRFGDARRQRRSCRREARLAATRRRFRRPDRRRPSTRSRMNTEIFSNNEEMTAVELIQLEKPLKLILDRRCWQTFSFPFIEGYLVQPVHLRLERGSLQTNRKIRWLLCLLLFESIVNSVGPSSDLFSVTNDLLVAQMYFSLIY